MHLKIKKKQSKKLKTYKIDAKQNFVNKELCFLFQNSRIFSFSDFITVITVYCYLQYC